MSLRSWMKEFYPVPANKVRGKVAAIKHSIQKWQGLSPAALKRHDIVRVDCELFDDDEHRFDIDSSTCALCQVTNTDCEDCPLYLVRGGVSCCFRRPDEGVSPYDDLVHGQTKGHLLMLKWLRKALKYAEAKQRKRKTP